MSKSYSGDRIIGGIPIPLFFSLFFYFSITFVTFYLFMPVLSHGCFAWAFPSWGKWETLPVAMLRLPAVVVWWFLLSRGTRPRVGPSAHGSVVVALGLSCSVAGGIFPDLGSNLFPIHWQADS